MKKLTAILLTATMLLSFAIGAFAENTEQEYADIADALAVLRALVGLENSACVTTHDFNENDVLDIGDALLVLRGLVGVGDMMVIRTGEVSEVVESSATTRVTERTTEATTTTEVTTTEPPVEPPETLSDEMRERIKADLRREIVENNRFGLFDGCRHESIVLYVHRYYGTFGDSVVVKMRVCCIDFPEHYVITIMAGLKFYYSACSDFIVWNNGNIYGFPESYKKGVLTYQNLEFIYSNFCFSVIF